MSVAKPENVVAAKVFESNLHHRIIGLLNTPDHLSNWWGAGIRWYEEAHIFAQSLTEFGVSVVQAAGVIAALSPQRQWQFNQVTARDYLDWGRQSHTAGNMAKCDQITAHGRDIDDVLEILNGSKTQDFFLSIVEPQRDLGAVAVDEHMCAFAGITSSMLHYKYGHEITVYERYRNLVRQTAVEAGIYSHQLQAVIWCVQRGDAD